LLEANLHPLTNAAAPGTPTLGAADVNLNLELAFDFTSLQFQVNGAAFTEPSVPVLLQILSGASAAQDLLPASSIYELPLDSVIELSIPGGSVGSPVSSSFLQSSVMLNGLA
jgi:iron transport multicopper oxidase